MLIFIPTLKIVLAQAGPLENWLLRPCKKIVHTFVKDTLFHCYSYHHSKIYTHQDHKNYQTIRVPTTRIRMLARTIRKAGYNYKKIASQDYQLSKQHWVELY